MLLWGVVTSRPSNVLNGAPELRHDRLKAVAFRGAIHFFGDLDSPKRSGGSAYGMPRNLFTGAIACGRLVWIPKIGPDFNTAVGGAAATTNGSI